MRKIMFVALILLTVISAAGCSLLTPGLNNNDYRLLENTYTKLLISAAIDFGFEGEPPAIKISEDFSDFFASSDSVTVCVSDIRSYGAALYSFSGGMLPAWLCTGYELYYLDTVGAIGGKGIFSSKGALGLSRGLGQYLKINFNETFSLLEWSVMHANLPFGDAWFIPDYASGTENAVNQAIIISRHFTEYLVKNELLEDVADMYMSGSADTEIIQSAWAGFIGSDNLPMDLSYRYYYGADKLFSVKTPNTVCHFYERDWFVLYVQIYLSEVEEKSGFMEDWFGYTAEKPLHYAFYKQERPEMPTDGNYIYLSAIKPTDRLVIAHQTAHYYAVLSGYHTENTHWVLGEGFAEFLAYESLSGDGKGFLAYNADFLAREDHFNKTLESQFPPNMNYKDFSGEFEVDIRTYLEAESFVRYLYNTYGRDGLLGVMPAMLSSSEIEKLCGKPYQEIINDWVAYLMTVYY